MAEYVGLARGGTGLQWNKIDIKWSQRPVVAVEQAFNGAVPPELPRGERRLPS